MFGIGMPELIVILLICLLVFGASKLPEIARSFGKAIGEFKKALREQKEDLDITKDTEDKDKKKV